MIDAPPKVLIKDPNISFMSSLCLFDNTSMIKRNEEKEFLFSLA